MAKKKSKKSKPVEKMEHCNIECAEACSGASMRCWLTKSVSVFLTIFVFDWIFHGHFMMPAYEATASLWRTQEEMEPLFHIFTIKNIVMALVITCLFKMCKPCMPDACRYTHGMKFGFKIGLLLGIVEFSSYAYMPIPMSMAVSWLVGQIVLGVLIGLVLGMCSNKSSA